MNPLGIDVNIYWWIFFGTAVVIGGAVIAQRYFDKKRREALAQLALRIGCSFSPKDPGLLSGSSLGRCPLFNLGQSRKANNVLRGSQGKTETIVFDYRYTIGCGEHIQTFRQTVAARQSPAPIAEFQLRPKRFFDGLARLFGRTQIEISTDTKFSSQYQLRGPDEMSVRRMFRPDVLALFNNKPGWSVESTGDWLIAYRRNKQIPPELFTSFMESTRTIASLFFAS